MPTPDALEALGSLAGVLVVVLLFLKHISSQRVLDSKRDQDHVERMKDICDDFRNDSRLRKDEIIKCLDRATDVMGENSKVLGETSAVLGNTADVLRQVNSKK